MLPLIIFPVNSHAPAPELVGRHRKAHTKSRAGCLTCKSRRVKCDEARPVCLSCAKRLLKCVYNRLHISDVIAKQTRTKDGAVSTYVLLAPSTHATTAALIDVNLKANPRANHTTATFHAEDVLTLRHYRDLTCSTIGGGETQEVYRTEIVQLALKHSHLMHAILAMSAVHSRWLRSPSSPPLKSELFHWQQTLSEFGRILSQPLERGSADAILATATLVNGIAFAMVETNDYRRSWPLVDRNVNDLQWLSLQGGIPLVFRNTSALRVTSAFRRLFDNEEMAAVYGTGFESASLFITQLLHLCEVTSTSTSNPYFIPISLLAPLVDTPCTSADGVFRYLTFIASTSKDFITLLQAKDHRALLLLCSWYATICTAPSWWVIARSLVECRAIVAYLSNNASQEIRDLLPFAAKASGYDAIDNKYKDREKLRL